MQAPAIKNTLDNGLERHLSGDPILVYYRGRLCRARYVSRFDDTSSVVELDLGHATRLSGNGRGIATHPLCPVEKVDDEQIETDHLNLFLHRINKIFQKR